MPDLYKLFKMDATAEKDGVWVEYGDETETDKPARIKIARAGGSNTKYARVFETVMKPHRRELEAGLLDDATARKLYARIYADSVVLAWENVVVEGKPLEFNRANVVDVLTKLPDLLNDLRDQANRVAIFREALREEDSGNS